MSTLESMGQEQTKNPLQYVISAMDTSKISSKNFTTIPLKTNCDYSINCDSKWLSAQKMDNGNLAVFTQGDENYSTRTGSIILKTQDGSQSDTITVVQNGFGNIKETIFTTLGEDIYTISGNRRISGIYPHLCTYAHNRTNGKYNYGDECGIGGLAVWNGNLYMINYAAHYPQGSEHNLYIINPDMTMTLYPNSVGGTPAARMVHQESNQLLIGHYLIDKNGNIRKFDIKTMPGRMTAIARHLTDPTNKVYYYDMEGMLYEANVHTLETKLLFKNPLPGWHGKGAYTAQNKLILANNGESEGTFEPTEHWQVPQDGMIGPEKYGILAEFDGKKFTVVERKQFTDITTKNGINAIPNDNNPLWSIGWDKRSVRLKVLDQGVWHTYLLPKATNNNDPSHGWFTEWPRIREIGNGEMMMDMHGMFFEFPKTFCANNTAGIRPLSSHLRYIPDFCSWNNQIVIATDETSIQGNKTAGQPQSNLWFGTKNDLKQWGPSNGFGAIWLNDEVKAGQTSDPYLFAGFENQMIHLINEGDNEIKIKLQIDKLGNGIWTDMKDFVLSGKEYQYYICPSNIQAEWIRAIAQNDGKLSIEIHSTTNQYQKGEDHLDLFKGIADINTQEPILNAKLYANRLNYNLSCYTSITSNGAESTPQEMEFEKFKFDFKNGITDPNAKTTLDNNVYYANSMGKDFELWTVDQASVILHTKNGKLRLPKGASAFDNTQDFRALKEVESERELANIHGTFYEVPMSYMGEEPLYDMMRPVSSHNKLISDYTTWNGLLVLSGIKQSAVSSEHIYKANNDQAGLWFGGIDDLWKLGKPVGIGGPWYNTDIKANEKSDPYLMTGYDKKTLKIKTDKNTTITLWLDVTHYNEHLVKYKEFKVEAGKEFIYDFPEGFSAHWARLSADSDCNATAQFIYE